MRAYRPDRFVRSHGGDAGALGPASDLASDPTQREWAGCAVEHEARTMSDQDQRPRLPTLSLRMVLDRWTGAVVGETNGCPPTRLSDHSPGDECQHLAPPAGGGWQHLYRPARAGHTRTTTHGHRPGAANTDRHTGRRTSAAGGAPNPTQRPRKWRHDAPTPPSVAHGGRSRGVTPQLLLRT